MHDTACCRRRRQARGHDLELAREALVFVRRQGAEQAIAARILQLVHGRPPSRLAGESARGVDPRPDDVRALTPEPGVNGLIVPDGRRRGKRGAATGPVRERTDAIGTLLASAG
jgi:hypothetical protein